MNMAGEWKIAPVTFAAPLQAGDMLRAAAQEAIQTGVDLTARHFCDDALEALEGETLDISGCIFERCRFGELDLKRLSFVDCVFDKCEWSNVRLTGVACQRVQFRNCRMTGLELLRGMLMNTVFESCMLDYASFSETRLDRVMFENCRMRESLWGDVKLGKTRFSNADLTRTQWIRTPLAGMDMSHSLIGGWNISLFDLRGVKVTAAQVIELSGLLGVEIIE